MISCQRDADGYCRVDADDVHPAVGAYLEQDVQEDPATCQDLLDALDAVQAGRQPEWSGTGNAHTLTIRSDAVVIHNEYDDSLGDAVLTPDVFRGCVQAWQACITSP